MNHIFGTHHLPVRIKREFCHSRHKLSYIFFRYACVAKPGITCHCKQTVFRRIPYPLFPIYRRIVIKYSNIQQISVELLFYVNFIRIYAGTIYIYILNSHSVLCKRTGLIRTDYRYTSKALNRLQFFHYCVICCHFLCAHSLNNRNY